ncbi:plasmid replication protein RepC [Falsirhodobacter sp. alg1]|uniref:plasmid replication protein RepC n=1 Tax=Falsirhodobacter sp. alg1 TaxID=1472418 RepID=UPI0009E8B6E0|nr:plasmid replication protein RepC [Falsirhodobacter sp. alg1]
MKHIATTSFGRRPVSDGHLAHRKLADAPCPDITLDKWAILRDVSVARKTLGVTDRDLTVLQALVSFYPGQTLNTVQPTIVFPSNAKLSERLHGMPESTLRRHIAALVTAGLILRHDSPNGKRFARQDGHGTITRAFGFDLRPLLVRCQEFQNAAENTRREEQIVKELREKVVLHLRDLSRLVPSNDGMVWASIVEIQRSIRRKLSLDALKHIAVKVGNMLSGASSYMPDDAEEMSSNDSQNERHIQNSNKLISESKAHPNVEKSNHSVTAAEVVSVCTEARSYAENELRTWPQIIKAAENIYPMTGIDRSTWIEAVERMGLASAATAVLCILQRFSKITRPGAYLRTISRKATGGNFDVSPMVRALVGTPTAKVDSCQLC